MCGWTAWLFTFFNKLWKNVFYSAAGRRFPRASLQPPQENHPAGSSGDAISAGVTALRFMQLVTCEKLKVQPVAELLLSVHIQPSKKDCTAQLPVQPFTKLYIFVK
ncbi:hypothetical protein CR205_17485 [Alteribacter lacisalsi]|uniref:Uncharacterized protein n=1 Tax=Alteribacter lacisalsi TaxID=2045244 RepID=A0A2W0H651_9BACI|nr:hypothetical protein CR205_17485 [Alteribacter lacisalsi]